MINIYINNIKVLVERNTTVLQACTSVKIEIPKFCFQENLGIAGNCRMCLVEVANSPKPIAACAMPVFDQMRIYTNTPLVKKARESILEFLLINHPLDCPICDQGGECDLQDQTLYFGSTTSRFTELKRTVEDKYCGPFIKTIMTRCIHCTRCVRFTNEICGIDNLGTTGRGNHMEISFYINKIFQSEFSGNVIDLCPVGALTAKQFAFNVRPWELSKIKTIDILDSLGSNIIIQTFQNKIVRILPKLTAGLNIEWITDKTRFFFDSLVSQRLKEPMIKQNGHFVPITWEKAFHLIESKKSSIDPSQQKFLVGNLIDIKSLYSLKNIITSMGVQSVEYTTLYNNATVDGQRIHNYKFMTPLKNFEEVDLCLLVLCDPRKEGALLNLNLRTAVNKNNLKILSIGANVDLTYPVINLGLSLQILIHLLEGKHDVCKAILQANTFSILLGPNVYKIKNYQDVIPLLKKKFMVNLLNFESGFLNYSELFKTKPQINNNPQLLFLYNTDNVNIKRSLFNIYIGHHFTQNAQESDLILPSTTFVEKNSYFKNIEHKFQPSLKALPNLQNSKNDSLIWGLLILFYEMKPIHLPFNRFFNRLQTATELIPSTKKVETLSFVKSFFKPLIVNDVRTNILEINSKTLMKADIRKRPIKIC